MKGSFSLIAIFAIILAVVDVEADKLRELPTKFKNDYQPYVCEENTIEPHDSKCNIYYKCINKQLVLKECESGLHWDRTRNICTTPEEAKCPNYNLKACKEGSYKSDEKYCDVYYKCQNNQFVTKTCTSGFHWSQENNICTDPEEAGCSIAPPLVCEEGSVKPHESTCNLYYKCINNQLVLKECESGLHWDRTRKLCTTLEKANCPNYSPKVCKEGSYKPNDKECYSYYKCKNNQWNNKECPTGMLWNRRHTICTSPEIANCQNDNPGSCQEGSYKPNDKECDRFYKCKHNQWNNKECPIGMHWNRKHTICTSPEVANCQNDNPGSCKEGSYKPNDKECDKYYKCKDNQWYNKECPTGMHWNRDQKICTSPEVANCYNDLCEEGSYKPNDKECNRYYKCKDNQWYNKQCPTGMHWNREHTICILSKQSKCQLAV